MSIELDEDKEVMQEISEESIASFLNCSQRNASVSKAIILSRSRFQEWPRGRLAITVCAKCPRKKLLPFS